MNKIISNEELNELPVKGFEGEIVVLDYTRDVKKVIPYLKKHKMIGFDTETKPNFAKGNKNKVALLQLATEKSAFIFRIQKMGLPKELIEILSDANITKVGVAIKDDILALKKIHPFEPAGFVEIQEKVKDFQIESFSLKKLSGLVLGFRISKAQQTSNWEADELTEAQIKYAATDAWVSLGIYKRLLEFEKEMVV